MWVSKLLYVFAYIIFLNIQIISCEKGRTLAFAIDRTYSMTYVINSVKQQAQNILDISRQSTDIVNYVLVSIDDPVAKVKVLSNTNSSDVFAEDLNLMKASKFPNGDCEELSLTGVEKALEASRPGSYIYAFTDATAKDYRRVQEITSLSQEKQSQILFVLTGDCYEPNHERFKVYYKIAAASCGQVIRVKLLDFNSVLELTKALLKQKYSAITCQVMQPNPRGNGDRTVKFTVSGNVDFAYVSTSGRNVRVDIVPLDVTNHLEIDNFIYTDDFKVLKLNHPTSGEYTVKVSADGLISYVVYVPSDLSFEYGFSDDVPNSIKDTFKQPIAGKSHRLSINAMDPDSLFTIKSAQILDMQENVIKDMVLTNIDKNLYVTEGFVSSEDMFKIQVTGEIKKSGKPIIRIAKTAVKPRIILKAPDITNEVTNYYGVVGDKIMVIPCIATGYPVPTITWKNKNNINYKGFIYDVNKNSLMIHNLVKPNTDTAIIFECEANNRAGIQRKEFTIKITDDFTNDDAYYGNTKDIFVVKDTATRIKCNIVTADTLSVRWYKNGQLTEQTSKYYTIENLTVSDDGNYTCRINTLQGSHSETYVLDVGFAPYFTDSSKSLVTVNWLGENKILSCLTDAQPEAQISWSYNGKKSTNLYNIDVTDWGEYTCMVTNVHGTTQKTFQVISQGCYLKNPQTLMTTEQNKWPDKIVNGGVVVKEHETIKLSCPAYAMSSNAFELFPRKTEITAQCQTKDQLTINGQTYSINDLRCKLPIEPKIVRTSEQCAGANTALLKVGFAMTEFLEAYIVCYDTSKKVPVYANMTYKLSNTEEKSIDLSMFKWHHVLELGAPPSGGYNCATSNTCCYERAQLLKVDQFAIELAQSASFLDNLNSVALWNPCPNNFRTSWQTLEKRLEQEKSNFNLWSSWTGASEYVAKNGGLVPRYLWKFLQYDDDSIAIVYVNDESPVVSDIRCTQRCDLVKTTDRFLYCCSADEFRTAFGIPLDTFVV